MIIIIRKKPRLAVVSVSVREPRLWLVCPKGGAFLKKSHHQTSDLPIYLFKQGKNFECQRFFGSHLEKRGDYEGVVFRVWAPRAKAVSVVGDFNSWIPTATPMTNLDPDGGIWECFVPGLEQFDIYKYCVTTPTDELVQQSV